jgi:hypothetical protein
VEAGVHVVLELQELEVVFLHLVLTYMPMAVAEELGEQLPVPVRRILAELVEVL